MEFLFVYLMIIYKERDNKTKLRKSSAKFVDDVKNLICVQTQEASNNGSVTGAIKKLASTNRVAFCENHGIFMG